MFTQNLRKVKPKKMLISFQNQILKFCFLISLISVYYT